MDDWDLGVEAELPGNVTNYQIVTEAQTELTWSYRAD